MLAAQVQSPPAASRSSIKKPRHRSKDATRSPEKSKSPARSSPAPESLHTRLLAIDHPKPGKNPATKKVQGAEHAQARLEYARTMIERQLERCDESEWNAAWYGDPNKIAELQKEDAEHAQVMLAHHKSLLVVYTRNLDKRKAAVEAAEAQA